MANISLGVLRKLESAESSTTSPEVIGLVRGESSICNHVPSGLKRRETGPQPNSGIDVRSGDKLVSRAGSSMQVGGPGSALKSRLMSPKWKTKITPGVAIFKNHKTLHKTLQKEMPLSDAIAITKCHQGQDSDVINTSQNRVQKPLFPTNRSNKTSQSHSQNQLDTMKKKMKKKTKSTKQEPEIMDLVSDDSVDESESECEPDPLRSNSELPTVHRGTLISKELPVSSHDTEVRDTSSHVNFVQVQKVYLGKRCYSSESLPIAVKITKHGLEMVISAKSASMMKNNDTFQILITTSEMNCVFLDKHGDFKETSSERQYIVFDPKNSISNNVSLSKEIPIGQGKTLSLGKNTKQNPAQYIVLVFDHLDALARYQLVCLQLEKYMSNLKQKTLTANQLFVEKTTIDQQNLWISEANGELARHMRTTRRSKRRRESNSLAIGDHVDDNNTFIVYPIHEDVKDKITITNGDMRRLTPPEYLNDNLIDFKIKHMLHEQFREKLTKVHCFPSYFYERLCNCSTIEEGYKNVATWTKNVDIFNCEMLIVPINQHAHWSVLFILKPHLIFQNHKDEKKSISKFDGGVFNDNTSHGGDNDESACIVCLDSLAMHNTNSLMKNMKKYLLEEYISKKCEEDNCKTSEKYKSLKNVIDSMNSVAMKDIPTQDNNYDCGMYLIKYVETMLSCWPQPYQTAIKNKFRGVFDKDHFSPTQITEERKNFCNLLKDLKPAYGKDQEEKQKVEAEEKRLKRQKQKTDGLIQQ